MIVAPLVALGFAGPNLRPPAVPLIAHDPYFSVWSPADNLYDADTVHWTGKPQPMCALVRVDGTTYRLMGTQPSSIPPLPQLGLIVTPTRSIYRFGDASITVFLQFCSPLLPDKLDWMARPATYATFYARSNDGKPHHLDVYFEVDGMLAVDHAAQNVKGERWKVAGLVAQRVGSVDQQILGRAGDDLRIEWGHAYLAGDEKELWTADLGDAASMRAKFQASGSYEGLGPVPPEGPVEANKLALSMIASLDVRESKMPSATAIIAYDDEYSIQYFDRRLRPYWRRNGMTADQMLIKAASERETLLDRCLEFDNRLTKSLVDVGGKKYAELAALAYRQAIAACKIAADERGKPLLFPKENFSNGCVNTVDVIYPMSPLFFLLGPDLARAMLAPILDYGSSRRWKFPFAPHDLGTYPLATGQVYGGGEVGEANQMPVEESGNMILLVAALSKIEGNASFAGKYWPALTKWAEFLKAKGLDPENQLCTDDFMGHLAHNANLSVKAILALGAFGRLCEMRGESERGKQYLDLARDYARQWIAMAVDGGPSKLAFDKSGTWSQKYNLVWDSILGLDLFPDQLKRDEMAFYRRSMNRFGLPLDNRSAGTKTDWIHWTATLTGNRADFDALIDPVWDFYNETVDRVPLSDWVKTDEPKHVGFVARSVVGGFFLPLIADAKIWADYYKAGQKTPGAWAKLPLAVRKTVVASAIDGPQSWRYSTENPGIGWMQPGFKDDQWPLGRSGFGTEGTPGAVIGTTWDSSDVWIRRTTKLAKFVRAKLRLLVHHDEDAEIYLNGILAAKLRGYSTGYRVVDIRPEALDRLATRMPVVIAAHCHQTSGGQYIDVGLIQLEEP